MKIVPLFGAVAFALAFAAGPIYSNVAFAKSDKEAKAQLKECKKLADPKARDECVKKVGKGAEMKAKAEKEAKETKGK